jgi:hypothetical protein
MEAGEEKMTGHSQDRSRWFAVDAISTSRHNGDGANKEVKLSRSHLKGCAEKKKSEAFASLSFKYFR